MKTSLPVVWFTTAYVFAFAVLARCNVHPMLIWIIFATGVVLIPYMVYRVLTDNYHTDKTFADWYEDNPRNEE